MSKSSDMLMQDVLAFLNSITLTKENLVVTEEDERRYEKCRWLVLRGLSMCPDLIEVLNMINGMSIPPRMEYEFFLNFIPAKFRRPKWAKKLPRSVFMNSIQQYYQYNQNKAEQAMKLLSVEQLVMIEERIQKEDKLWETFSGATGSK